MPLIEFPLLLLAVIAKHVLMVLLLVQQCHLTVVVFEA
jgi:hypothetical protein